MTAPTPTATQTLYGVMVRLLARLPRYPHPTGAG